jgi:hypothetical protein
VSGGAGQSIRREVIDTVFSHWPDDDSNNCIRDEQAVPLNNRNKKIGPSLPAYLVVLLVATPAMAEELPVELVAPVARAERLGKALAGAAPAAKAATRPGLNEAKQKGADLCSFTYKQVSIDDGGDQLSYLVATTRRATDVVIGRHFLMGGSGAVPSSKSCLNLGTPRDRAGQEVAFLTVTHLMSPSPNEFHVYLTLTQPVPLVVLTEAGIWIVEKGTIRFEGSHDAEAALASNAPEDKPHGVREGEFAAMEAAIAPYIAKARESYPAARDRYLAGLPPGHIFYVTTRLRDQDGRHEQVFIRVSKISGGEISGRVASDIRLVSGYRQGQAYSFQEAELIDWMVARPDGTEEGNVVGKFLDTVQR